MASLDPLQKEEESMITAQELLSLEKDALKEFSERITAADIVQLTNWLSEKDDSLRYNAFLVLQNRSRLYEDVYPYWSIFEEKLKSSNSYQRSIGLMLIAANARWDKDNRLENSIDAYLALLNDEKPITVRQCIQALGEITPYKQSLLDKITGSLMAFDIYSVRETMQKLILADIVIALADIRKYQSNGEIENFIVKALSGGILDKKAVKQISAIL